MSKKEIKTKTKQNKKNWNWYNLSKKERKMTTSDKHAFNVFPTLKRVLCFDAFKNKVDNYIKS